MNTFHRVILLLTVSLAFDDGASASTNLLPGVTYYNGTEKLTGKLDFLLNSDYTMKSNSEASASIYELDLQEQKLRKVTDSPNGRFHVSDEGDVFCVVYWLGGYMQGYDKNVFIYSKSLNLKRVLSLEASPKDTVVFGNHVFFQLEGWNYDRSGSYLVKDRSTRETKLLHYDIAKNKTRPVELSDASQWEYHDYGGVLASLGQTNIIHFKYKSYGKRLDNGKDYPEGYYDYDVESGSISGPAQLMADEYDRKFSYKTFDGRFVFFEGSGAPVEGFKLVSSLGNDLDTADEPKGKDVKVLHSFSVLAAFNRSNYGLVQMSPDGHYALVRLQEPTTRKTEEISGYATGFSNTYYLVDVSTGKTRVLLKDDADATTRSSVVGIRWVK